MVGVVIDLRFLCLIVFSVIYCLEFGCLFEVLCLCF